MDQVNKVFHSALIIQPPMHCIEEIQQIRSQNDKAYERWMPHVNLSFPFVDPMQFDQVHTNLQKAFDNFPAFKITLSQFGYFKQGKQAVMWVQPSCDNNEIQQVYQRILNTYPVLNDLGQKGEHGYSPHLTLGQFQLKNIQEEKYKLEKNFQKQEFMCTELHMIARNGANDPFKVIKTIKLQFDGDLGYQFLGK